MIKHRFLVSEVGTHPWSGEFLWGSAEQMLRQLSLHLQVSDFTVAMGGSGWEVVSGSQTMRLIRPIGDASDKVLRRWCAEQRRAQP